MSTEADTVVYTYLKVQYAYTKLAAKFKTNRQLSESKLWSGAPTLLELIKFYKDNNTPAFSEPVVEVAAPVVEVAAPVVEVAAPVVEPEVTVVEPVVPVVKVKKGKKRKLSVTIVENKAAEVIDIEDSLPTKPVVVEPVLSKKEIKKAKKLAKKEKKAKKEVVVISDSPTPVVETNGAETNGVEEVAAPVVEVAEVVEEVSVPAVNGGGMVVAAASDAEDESEEEVEQPQKKAKKVKRGQSESFRRVKEEDIIIKKKELGDNAFEAKGGADGYGYMANQVLKFTKGKSFRHEKTKKKRGTYKGGEINMGVTSIKFDSD